MPCSLVLLKPEEVTDSTSRYMFLTASMLLLILDFRSRFFSVEGMIACLAEESII